MYSQENKLCRLLPTYSLVKGEHCCRVKISSFPKETDAERLSGELGDDCFQEGSLWYREKMPLGRREMEIVCTVGLVSLCWNSET